MSDTFTVSRPSEQWVVICLIYFCTMIVNSLMLAYELQKRLSKQATFTTKMLEYFSLLTIISAVVTDLCRFVQYFNGFCYVAWQMTNAFALQLSFMGLYQISRLYYSFAQSKVHSNKGYPNWLIYAMYIIGLLSIINAQVLSWGCIHIPVYCGINKNFEYIAKYNDYHFSSASTKWFGISLFTSVLWDSTTLALYIIKVASFREYKSKQVTVYNRIMTILNRILILTVSYEITYFMYVFAGVLYLLHPKYGVLRIIFTLTASLSSITMNYSILLMQSHNTVQYKKFLMFSYKIGVYNIFCFFKSFVRNEIEIYLQETESNGNPQNKKQVENNSPDTDNVQHEDTIYETGDNTIKNEHSMMIQLSVDTTMQPVEINV